MTALIRVRVAAEPRMLADIVRELVASEQGMVLVDDDTPDVVLLGDASDVAQAREALRARHPEATVLTISGDGRSASFVTPRGRMGHADDLAPDRLVAFIRQAVAPITTDHHCSE